ncbi:type II toxin-antitoxin system Phd/YefM family antitoxin [uncultured Sphingomonas sp.]|jgi:prevent-host-death family protein|uniref:type II toxin-antitoxin system Phd/YefM family antitoxin n=1 Tax=uncultured Sphingomonas sp. TaxID=158754 RepID=UPI0025CCBD9B|nr:type II toxin-antitoxin system Phd/YefM family antitoxin [uncultured Sphingomonas sp.]
MGKVIGAAEFKAKCLSILDQVQATGEAVTVTKRGKPVAVLNPAPAGSERVEHSAIGFLKSDKYRDDWDPEIPATDLDDWEALR